MPLLGYGLAYKIATTFHDPALRAAPPPPPEPPSGLTPLRVAEAALYDCEQALRQFPILGSFATPQSVLCREILARLEEARHCLHGLAELAALDTPGGPLHHPHCVFAHAKRATP